MSDTTIIDAKAVEEASSSGDKDEKVTIMPSYTALLQIKNYKRG